MAWNRRLSSVVLETGKSLTKVPVVPKPGGSLSVQDGNFCSHRQSSEEDQSLHEAGVALCVWVSMLCVICMLILVCACYVFVSV